MLKSRAGQKVGFIASCFDLGPHAGHLVTLEEAKNNCSYLIVALQVDPSRDRAHKNKPIPTVSERYISVAACKFADEIIPYESEEELENLLKLLQPDIRFLGEDYRNKEFTGSKLPIPIHFCSRKHTVSSSGTRKKIHEAEEKKKTENSTTLKIVEKEDTDIPSLEG